MSGQTIAQAQAMLDKYYEAQTAIADGKSFTFATENGSRQMTAENLGEIRRQIQILERRVSAGSGRNHNFSVAKLSS